MGRFHQSRSVGRARAFYAHGNLPLSRGVALCSNPPRRFPRGSHVPGFGKTIACRTTSIKLRFLPHLAEISQKTLRPRKRRAPIATPAEMLRLHRDHVIAGQPMPRRAAGAAAPLMQQDQRCSAISKRSRALFPRVRPFPAHAGLNRRCVGRSWLCPAVPRLAKPRLK